MAPEPWINTYGSIYSAACQMALRTTSYWMDKNKYQRPIAYFFERGHKFWKETDEILAATGLNAELKQLYRYHSHTSLEKESSCGLQAADMLSWIASGAMIGFKKNHTMKAFEPVIIGLTKDQSHRYQMFYPTGDKLKRFFAYQTSHTSTVIVRHNHRASALR
jgi:hypothetical protein